MPAAWNRASSNLRCEEAGCESKTYSTSSNLARHIQSKHGEPVQMPCGIIRQDHRSNSRRHQFGCSGCRAILGLPSLDALGSPILNDTINEVENTIDTIDVAGAHLFDDNLVEPDSIFEDIGTLVLDNTVDEVANAFAINSRDHINVYGSDNGHYFGLL